MERLRPIMRSDTGKTSEELEALCDWVPEESLSLRAHWVLALCCYVTSSDAAVWVITQGIMPLGESLVKD